VGGDSGGINKLSFFLSLAFCSKLLMKANKEWNIRE
jgi:hypothetical protein